jgi:hypothetical protein
MFQTIQRSLHPEQRGCFFLRNSERECSTIPAQLYLTCSNFPHKPGHFELEEREEASYDLVREENSFSAALRQPGNLSLSNTSSVFNLLLQQTKNGGSTYQCEFVSLLRSHNHYQSLQCVAALIEVQPLGLVFYYQSFAGPSFSVNMK